jgi:ataxia telangiectasia mutated family protein
VSINIGTCLIRQAGFGFSHESATTWAALELYADAAIFLHSRQTSGRSQSATSYSRGVKRRRLEDTLAAIISQLESGPFNSRLLALQMLVFVIGRSWVSLAEDARASMRRALLEHLDDEHLGIQSWSFVGMAIFARRQTFQSGSSQSMISGNTTTSDWERAWSHSIRKVSQATLCRAACHLADTLLGLSLIDATRAGKDISSVLRHIEIQGPSYPFDSVCAFLTNTIKFARGDVRLYSLNLEDKIVAWWDKWSAVEGSRGKARMDPQTTTDLLKLLQQGG